MGTTASETTFFDHCLLPVRDTSYGVGGRVRLVYKERYCRWVAFHRTWPLRTVFFLLLPLRVFVSSFFAVIELLSTEEEEKPRCITLIPPPPHGIPALARWNFFWNESTFQERKATCGICGITPLPSGVMWPLLLFLVLNNGTRIRRGQCYTVFTIVSRRCFAL